MTPRRRDDQDYWDELARRVAAGATHDGRTTTVEWLAHSPTAWITMTLVLAVALAFAMRFHQESSDAVFRAAWSAAVLPSDRIGQRVTAGDQPPVVGELLFSDRNGGRR